MVIEQSGVFVNEIRSPTPTHRRRFLPSLASRWAGVEIQDDVKADQADLRRMLRDFRMVNALISDTAGLLHREILPRIRNAGKKLVSVLDIGSGGCDQALLLARLCRKEKLPVRITCLDADPRAVAFGRAACAGVSEINVHCADAFDLESVQGPVDFIMANHFLHHIETERIPCLLALMGRKAKSGFIVSDLRRRYWAYAGFSLLAAVLWPRGDTRHDGLLSIRRGFTTSELAGHLRNAQLDDARVWTRFPARVGVSCFHH